MKEEIRSQRAELTLDAVVVEAAAPRDGGSREDDRAGARRKKESAKQVDKGGGSEVGSAPLRKEEARRSGAMRIPTGRSGEVKRQRSLDRKAASK